MEMTNSTSDDIIKYVIRIFGSVLLLILTAFVVYSISVSGSTGILTEASNQQQLPLDDRHQIAPPANGTTIISTQGFKGRSGWALFALSPNGRLLYYNDTYGEYGDIDPSPRGKSTITYIATKTLNKSTCGAVRKCSRDLLIRTNLTTKESEILYSRKQAHKPGENIHDVDRISDSKFIIADIVYNRVYIVNTTTGLVTWEWNAQQVFPLAGGGPYPEDWTHMNDVEVIDQGEYMISLRNQDQVIFLDKQKGLISNKTLGSEDTHTILFEQHNPDYIPSEQGGPAIVVADSQNNRIIEYQRTNDHWNQSWVWRDSSMRWPRDADRLPNGNTLITDSNSNRIMEINRQGEIIWKVRTSTPYEAERLETGDESLNGPSASKINLATRVETGQKNRIKAFVENRLPPKVVNAIRFLFPGWASLYQVLAVGLIGLIGTGWGCLELLWLPRKIRIQSPIAELSMRSPLSIEASDQHENTEESSP